MKFFLIGFAGLVLFSLVIISVDNQIFAMHGNPEHHEQMEHHKQQAMQHDENCRTGQSCDHAQAAEHHSQAAMNCHEIGDHECSAVHYSEAARHHKEMDDHTMYSKYHAHSLHHKGIAKYGDSYVLPPRHQMHIVDDPSNIQCKEGLEIIFKSTTGHPHCVTSHTAERLVSMGWGHH